MRPRNRKTTATKDVTSDVAVDQQSADQQTKAEQQLPPPSLPKGNAEETRSTEIISQDAGSLSFQADCFQDQIVDLVDQEEYDEMDTVQIQQPSCPVFFPPPGLSAPPGLELPTNFRVAPLPCSTPTAPVNVTLADGVAPAA